MTEHNHQTFNEQYFYVEHVITKLNNYDLEVGEFIINEFPEETLSFNVKFAVPKNCYAHDDYSSSHCVCDTFPFEMKLDFKNSLHLLSDEYHYKIRCFLKGTIDNDIFLFSHNFRRTNDAEKFVSFTTNCDKNFNQFKTAKISLEIHRQRVKDGSLVVPNRSFSDLFANICWYQAHSGNVSIDISGEIFYVSKQILMLRGSMFQKMFSHDMVENKDNIIYIKDYDVETIRIMLCYIYTNETRDIHKRAVDVFRAAHYYGIEDLKDDCLECMKFNFTPADFVSYLHLTDLYELDDLKKKLCHYMESKEAELIEQKDFQNYLLESITMDTVVLYLKKCNKYPLLHEFKTEVFKFSKENIENLMKTPNFLRLFKDLPSLVEDIFTFIHTKHENDD